MSAELGRQLRGRVALLSAFHFQLSAPARLGSEALSNASSSLVLMGYGTRWARNSSSVSWKLNIDPAITEAQLDQLRVVDRQLVAGTFSVDGIQLDKTKEDGVVRAGFRFDFDFGFPDGSFIYRFSSGDKVKLLLALPAATKVGFTEESFNYADATGTYTSAAHIRNTTVNGESGWIGATFSSVPEPSTYLDGALLLLPLALLGPWSGQRANATEDHHGGHRGHRGHGEHSDARAPSPLFRISLWLRGKGAAGRGYHAKYAKSG